MSNNKIIKCMYLVNNIRPYHAAGFPQYFSYFTTTLNWILYGIKNVFNC